VLKKKTSLLVALAMGLGLVGAPAQADSGPITIVRDSYGVPHVYADTAVDVSYGAGYALAQDRLWQMHILRLLTKGNLSRLLGDLILSADQEARFWLYTPEERAARFATYPADIRENLEAWRDGINAWIAEVHADPVNNMPFEFVEFAELPIEPWTLDDSLAIGDYLIWTFGSGGGREVSNLADLQRAIAEHGEALGTQLYDEVRYTIDPDAPASIPEDFDWRNEPTHARPEADNKTLEDDARLSLPEDQKVVGPAAQTIEGAKLVREMITQQLDDSVLSQIEQHEAAQEALRKMFWRFGSNAQIVDSHRTTTGNTALQAGPQVSYFAPGIVVDFGLHSADGKLDATGMTFAGAGPAVLIGRGNGYNWTTTTGDSDLTDTYIEVLHQTDDRAYMFDADGSDGPGEPVWERMDCRIEEYKVKGLVEIATQEICRTRHGPVMAFDLENRRAYSARMAWMNREGGTIEGFWRYGEAKSLEDFATYSNMLASNHNMFYADDQGNIGYWHPGNHPIRPAGYDIRFPLPGTGDAEWEGLYPAQLVPHAVNHPSGVLANWNNKPAFDWPRERGWGAYHDVVQLQQNLAMDGPVNTDPWGGTVNADRKVDFQDLNANIRYAAFRHDDADFFQRYLPTSGITPLEDQALEVLADYDGFIIDRNEDGFVDSAGYTILDRFVSKLRSQVLYDDLGSSLRGLGDKSKLIHALDPDSRFPSAVDFLNGQTVEQAAARAFTSAVEELYSQMGGHPRDWKREQPMTHYTRLNADLATDVVREMLRDELKANTGLDPEPLKPGGLPVPPGNYPDHQNMDRGTYNHLIVYTDEPSGSGVLGESRAQHGSVISAGQNGFTNIFGQEGPHSRDQWDLYVEWRYKPMPMTLAESMLESSSVQIISR
jgi:penicillin G amidase